MITVYYGEGVEDEQAQAVTSMLQGRYPEAEVMALCGGQPVYSYIISVE